VGHLRFLSKPARDGSSLNAKIAKSHGFNVARSREVCKHAAQVSLCVFVPPDELNQAGSPDAWSPSCVQRSRPAGTEAPYRLRKQLPEPVFGRSNRIFGSLAALEMPIRVVMNVDGR
jgi:hypothetical protein